MNLYSGREFLLLCATLVAITSCDISTNTDGRSGGLGDEDIGTDTANTPTVDDDNVAPANDDDSSINTSDDSAVTDTDDGGVSTGDGDSTGDDDSLSCGLAHDSTTGCIRGLSRLLPTNGSPECERLFPCRDGLANQMPTTGDLLPRWLVTTSGEPSIGLFVGLSEEGFFIVYLSGERSAYLGEMSGERRLKTLDELFIERALRIPRGDNLGVSGPWHDGRYVITQERDGGMDVVSCDPRYLVDSPPIDCVLLRAADANRLSRVEVYIDTANYILTGGPVADSIFVDDGVETVVEPSGFGCALDEFLREHRGVTSQSLLQKTTSCEKSDLRFSGLAYRSSGCREVLDLDGFCHTRPSAISRSGRFVVGSSLCFTDEGLMRHTGWLYDGVEFREIVVAGAASVAPQGVSDSGVVVGVYNDALPLDPYSPPWLEKGYLFATSFEVSSP